MKNQTHTPTPWFNPSTGRAGNSWTFITTDDFRKIAKVLPIHPRGQREAGDFATEAANAAFIVRAVNSHDALVGALENCIETLEAAKRQANGGAEWIAVIEARAVLKLAEGE